MLEVNSDTISKFESKIIINNISSSLANSLRRIMISEVPTISIDIVSIEINTSLINDEFLSHRLGLIPLKSNSVKKLKYTRECECDNFCSKCSSIFNIDLRCNKEEIIVYSKHLECLKRESDFLGDSIFPIHDSSLPKNFSSKSIVIAKLKTGQQIKLVCVAKKGTGLEHSKWSPISTLKLKAEPFFYLDLINLNKILSFHQKEILNKLEEKIFCFNENVTSLIFLKQDKKEFTIISQKKIKFLIDFLLSNQISSENILKLEINCSKITFTMETTGVLTANEIFKESILILKRKLNIIGVYLEKN
jgi:DNA-directed RNA polymerase II subunit RPB3|mmetsp:Transcript_43526/g.69910  ORF Transcript_43526/g.69910 Transcript_43526/m.69910 type:complete len:305 (-) Transcript_43526:58-972(-)